MTLITIVYNSITQVPISILESVLFRWMAVLTLTSILAISLHHFHRILTFFNGTGIPHVKPLPLVGNFLPFLLQRRPVCNVITKIYNLNGEAKYVGMYDAMTPAIMIRDPELIMAICVKNFESFTNHCYLSDAERDYLIGRNLPAFSDDEWRRKRKVLTATFTSGKIKSMFTELSEQAENLVGFICESPRKGGRIVEMLDAIKKYGNDSLALAALGLKLDSTRNPENDFYKATRDVTDFVGMRTLKFIFLRCYPRLARWVGAKTVLPEEVGRNFAAVIGDVIKKRIHRGFARSDMIQLMLDARKKSASEREFDMEEMVSQAFIFSFGSLVNASVQMSFVAYTIALEQEIQAKLRQEIDEVLERTNGTFLYEDVNKMKYLDAVINESLRLHTVFTFVERRSGRDFALPPCLPGGKPFVVKKGMGVFLPIFAIQRDGKYFENPSKFDPSRFLGENRKKIKDGTFMPFGLGPRSCLAVRFSMLQMKLLFFHLLARCELKPCSKTTVPITYSAKSLVLLAENGYWLEVRPRSDKKCYDRVTSP